MPSREASFEMSHVVSVREEVGADFFEFDPGGFEVLDRFRGEREVPVQLLAREGGQIAQLGPQPLSSFLRHQLVVLLVQSFRDLDAEIGRARGKWYQALDRIQ